MPKGIPQARKIDPGKTVKTMVVLRHWEGNVGVTEIPKGVAKVESTH